MEVENIAVSLCVIIVASAILRIKRGRRPHSFFSFKIVWGTLIPEDSLFLVQFNNSMVSGTENSISGFSFAYLGIFYNYKTDYLKNFMNEKCVTLFLFYLESH